MDATNYWIMSFEESRPSVGGGRGRGRGSGSLRYLPDLASNNSVRPTSFGNNKMNEAFAELVQMIKPLNPYAKEWSPVANAAPEEDRCLFVTFSNGQPITEQEIARFFTHKYGDCLERVYVHWPKLKNYRDVITPQFGKVTFKASSIPLTMTNCGKKESKFIVDGKPLWCKMFDPSKTQSFRRN